MMGGNGPATGRMFGGLNNISGNLLRGLNNLGGSGGGGGGGGLGALGSLLGGGGGGLGALGSLLGGSGGLGGLGGLGNLANLAGMAGMGGNGGGGRNAGTPDLASILGNVDINAILSQLGNMQAQAPAAAAKTEAEAPIKDAQFKPVDEPGQGGGNSYRRSSGHQERREQAEQAEQAATGTGANNSGIPNINPQILQLLGDFLSRRTGAAAPPADKAPPVANTPPAQAYAHGEYYPPPPPAYDTCFNCPLSCPRAGLKLPPYDEVRQQAQDWRRY